ncbi:MAG: hypothetical protein GY811_22205 [Myxococcales bacterium]|nr:hypothetical protein [Myxococcales bacterium]
MLRFLLISSLLGSTALAACGSPSDSDDDCSDDRCDETAELKLCAAVRGNGELISSHFASLARIVEHYGPIDGAAGGSSASISIFMTESMQMNPATTRCGESACDDAEVAARTALLLKSFPAYLQHLTTTKEAAAVGQLLPIVQKIQEAGIENLLDEDVEAGLEALDNVLKHDDLRELINPEIFELLQTSPTPEKHARDILAGVQSLGAFSADSDKILIHPGLLNFAGLADKLGRVGDFYAGYGPSDGAAMQDFMAGCATPSLGKSWFEAAAIPVGESTCGALFDVMVGNYRNNLSTNPIPFESRIDDNVGAGMNALVSTSILSGDTAESFSKARVDYNAGRDYDFRSKFSDVSFGYWGQEADLRAAGRNDNDFQDRKTAMFADLGSTTWRTALSYSPAEPGLARGLELGNGLVSAGGWSDLHPVQALRNMGCENIVYVTRTGEESGFAQGVANLLGMDAETQESLYDLDASSSYALSLTEADATWCTDWNAQSGTDLLGITLDGYNAPMESHNAFFTEAKTAYGNLSEATDLRGCTPGAAPAPSN